MPVQKTTRFQSLRRGRQIPTFAAKNPNFPFPTKKQTKANRDNSSEQNPEEFDTCTGQTQSPTEAKGEEPSSLYSSGQPRKQDVEQIRERSADVLSSVGKKPSLQIKNAQAIFNVVENPQTVRRQEKIGIEVINRRSKESEREKQLAFGLEDSQSSGSEDMDDDAEYSDISTQESGERLQHIVTGLEGDLKKLQSDLDRLFDQRQAKVSSNPSSPVEHKTKQFVDLFERQPPDDAILLQYFPSMYKTTDEILSTPKLGSSIVPDSPIQLHELLEEVQGRMRLLTDNLQWSGHEHSNQELSGLLNLVKVDHKIMTERLQIKQLVDDYISSVDSQIKAAVQKHLENENKANLVNTPAKMVEVTKLPDETKETNAARISKRLQTVTAKKTKRPVIRTAKTMGPPPPKPPSKQKSGSPVKNRPLSSKVTARKISERLNSQNVVPGTARKVRASNQIKFSSARNGNKKKPDSETVDDSDQFSWDEDVHGHLFGNLLGLGRRFTNRRPYFHLQNPLPPNPVPWPPSPQSLKKKVHFQESGINKRRAAGEGETRQRKTANSLLEQRIEVAEETEEGLALLSYSSSSNDDALTTTKLESNRYIHHDDIVPDSVFIGRNVSIEDTFELSSLPVEQRTKTLSKSKNDIKSRGDSMNCKQSEAFRLQINKNKRNPSTLFSQRNFDLGRDKESIYNSGDSSRGLERTVPKSVRGEAKSSDGRNELENLKVSSVTNYVNKQKRNGDAVVREKELTNENLENYFTQIQPRINVNNSSGKRVQFKKSFRNLPDASCSHFSPEKSLKLNSGKKISENHQSYTIAEDLSSEEPIVIEGTSKRLSTRSEVIGTKLDFESHENRLQTNVQFLVNEKTDQKANLLRKVMLSPTKEIKAKHFSIGENHAKQLENCELFEDCLTNRKMQLVGVAKQKSTNDNSNFNARRVTDLEIANASGDCFRNENAVTCENDLKTDWPGGGGDVPVVRMKFNDPNFISFSHIAPILHKANIFQSHFDESELLFAHARKGSLAEVNPRDEDDAGSPAKHSSSRPLKSVLKKCATHQTPTQKLTFAEENDSERLMSASISLEGTSDDVSDKCDRANDGDGDSVQLFSPAELSEVSGNRKETFQTVNGLSSTLNTDNEERVEPLESGKNELSPGKSVTSDETKESVSVSLKPVEENLLDSSSTDEMVQSSEPVESISNSASDSAVDILKTESPDVADPIILPGFSPVSVKKDSPPQQHRIQLPRPRIVASGYKLPSVGQSLPQQSLGQLFDTTKDWVERELVARTISLRLHSSEGIETGTESKAFRPVNHPPKKQILVEGDSAFHQLLGSEGVQIFRDSGQSVDERMVQELVQEVVKEKALEMFRSLGASSSKDAWTIRSGNPVTANTKSNHSRNIIKTPEPTPPPSPVPTYSDEFEGQSENSKNLNEKSLLTPVSSEVDVIDNGQERLPGGGIHYENKDTYEPPFSAYVEEVPAPTPTPTTTPPPTPPPPMDVSTATSQIVVLRAPDTPLPSESISSISHEQLQQPPIRLVADGATQTSPSLEGFEESLVDDGEELHVAAVAVNQLPMASKVDKATSPPASPDVTSSSPISISDGEWLHLRPWQSLAPFVRYAHQISQWNSSSTDNTLTDMEELEQDLISEGEIRQTSASDWRTSLLSVALATGHQPQTVFNCSDGSVNILCSATPGPSSGPSMLLATTTSASPGELILSDHDVGDVTFSQASVVFTPYPPAGVTNASQYIPTTDATGHSRGCIVRGSLMEPIAQEGPSHRIPIQHITVVDSNSVPNEDDLLLNALQQMFLPAEPGLIVEPTLQSLDSGTRRTFLERLVSEGEIRSSFPLTPNRASDPDHFRSWSRTHAMTIAKKTTSAPGLHSYMRYPLDDERLSALQQLPTVIGSRETSNTSFHDLDVRDNSDGDLQRHSSSLEMVAARKPTEPFVVAGTKPDSREVINIPSSTFAMPPIATTSRTSGLMFRDTTVDRQDAHSISTKSKPRKGLLKKSQSKGAQDLANIERTLSPNNDMMASTSTSTNNLQQGPSAEIFSKRNLGVLVRPSPGMLPEEMQGRMSMAMNSKNNLIDSGREMFKESSGNLMMGSLGTIDEESNEALPVLQKKKIPTSESDGDYPMDVELQGRFPLERKQKVVDRSMSHSADVSEGEVPARETRSHQ